MCFEMNIYCVENSENRKRNNKRKKRKIQIVRHKPTNERKYTINARINFLRNVKCCNARQAVYNRTQAVYQSLIITPIYIAWYLTKCCKSIGQINKCSYNPPNKIYRAIKCRKINCMLIIEQVYFDSR